MKNITWLTLSAFLASGFGEANTGAANDFQQAQSRPNIVLVMADDMAWADVGYNGQKSFETPHIDQLAADGMQFDHAYSGASVCSPSRACLISGMYSPRHNIYHPGNRARGKLEYMKLAVPNRVVKNETYDWFAAIGDLAPDVNSLAKVLKPAGYVSARYGKWHVGRDEQGFDISRDVRNGYRIKDCTEKLTDGGIEFMREYKDRPFFLFVSYYDVHKPLAADPEVVKKYQAKKERTGGDFNPVYAAMMEAVDTSVGRLRAELVSWDLRTIPCLFSPLTMAAFRTPRATCPCMVTRALCLKEESVSQPVWRGRTGFILARPAIPQSRVWTIFPRLRNSRVRRWLKVSIPSMACLCFL